ncbi:MAG: DUF2139 domain-containing protein, partial [Ignisphaera sp.]
GIFAVPIKDLFAKPWNPIRLWIYDGMYSQESSGLFGWFGGIPLKGFEKKILRIYTSKEAKIRIAEYTMLGISIEEDVAVKTGWNTISLENHYDIVAFKILENVDKILAEIILEP